MRRLLVPFLNLVLIAVFSYGASKGSFFNELLAIAVALSFGLWIFFRFIPGLIARQYILEAMGGLCGFATATEIAGRIGLERATRYRKGMPPTLAEIKRCTPRIDLISDELRRMTREKLLESRDSGFEPNKRYWYKLAKSRAYA